MTHPVYIGLRQVAACTTPEAQAAAMRLLRHVCTEACETMPDCERCGRRKQPHGRSVPLECGGSYCGWDCDGYWTEPKPGHLWPGESGERR